MRNSQTICGHGGADPAGKHLSRAWLWPFPESGRNPAGNFLINIHGSGSLFPPRGVVFSMPQSLLQWSTNITWARLEACRGKSGSCICFQASLGRFVIFPAYILPSKYADFQVLESSSFSRLDRSIGSDIDVARAFGTWSPAPGITALELLLGSGDFPSASGAVISHHKGVCPTIFFAKCLIQPSSFHPLATKMGRFFLP